MSTPLIGQRLSKYEIQAEIGRGGMGIVYRGYDTMLQRPVAVKVLPPTFSFDQEFVARFQREAVLAANLHHPHIVTIHDVGEQAGNHYIVMELLEGETLDHWLHRYGAMTPPQAGQLLQQLASALDYAHGRGIVHRDIKPSNIMLSPDGQVKLMDFGLVRAGEGSQLTRSGVVLGTPEYMAPEQALGESVDGCADVYALGVVLYRMLTGHVPFSRSTPYAVTYAHIHEPPPPLRTLRPDLPPAVEAVVLKALAKQPAERYGRAGQLAQDFQAAAQFGAYPAAGAGVAAAAAMRPPADQRAAPVAGGAQAKRTPPARTPPPPPATASMRKQRSLLPLFMALVVALLAVVIGAFWLLNRRDGEQPAVTAGQPAVELPAETLAAPPTPSPSPSPVEELAPTLAPEVVVSAEQPEPTQPPTSEAVPPTSTPLPQPTATQPPTREPATTVAPTNTSAPTATQPVAVVGGQALNVRSGPGTDYPVVGQLSRGARAEISGRNADSSWWQVVLASGAEGWVLASLVTVEGAVDQIAVAAVPTRPPTPTPPPTPPRPGLVFDFERDVLWKRGDQPYGTLQRSAEQVKAGAAAGKLSYDFAAVPDNYVVLMPQPAPALGNATGVVAWVHGDGSGHMLNAWVRDSGGEVRSYTFGRISHSGWAPMTAWFDDQAGWPNGHISGSDNGRLDPPSTLTALVLDAVPDGQASRGAIYIDEVTVTQEAIQQATPTPASLPPPSATTSSATLTRPPSAAQLAGLSGWLSVGAVFGLALAVDRRRRPAGCWRRWRRR
jgi:serine/threonine-protein kinase